MKNGQNASDSSSKRMPLHKKRDFEIQVWGDYPNWDDVARLVYGRRMWRVPQMRARLLAHWLDERHPHRERFQAQRDLIEEVLESELGSEELDLALRQRGSSLRCIAREIPSVFGSFF